MKRLYTYIMILLLSATAIRSMAQQLSDTYTKQRPVVIVCDWDKAPYEFLNDKGQPSGSNIDVMQAVMKELKLPCRFVMKDWSIALKTFERGDADIILANARRYRRDPYILSENIVNYNRIRVAMRSDSVGMVSLRLQARRLLRLLFHGRRHDAQQPHGVPDTQSGAAGRTQW